MRATESEASRAASRSACRVPRGESGVSGVCTTRAAFDGVSPWRSQQDHRGICASASARKRVKIALTAALAASTASATLGPAAGLSSR